MPKQAVKMMTSVQRNTEKELELQTEKERTHINPAARGRGGNPARLLMKRPTIVKV